MYAHLEAQQLEGVVKAALEENGFRNALIKATDACFEACNGVKK